MRFALLVILGCVGVTGCASRHSDAPAVATTAPNEDNPAPHYAELPDLSAAEERIMPISVGVEQYGVRTSKRGIVPELRPIEPTPAERAILGPEPEEEVLDELAFYRTPPGPEQGVNPMETAQHYGVFTEVAGVGAVYTRSRAVAGVDFQGAGARIPVGVFEKNISGIHTVQREPQYLTSDRTTEFGIGREAHKAGRSTMVND